MKYYVYAGYYENFISGHKLPKPYTLRDEFKTFDEALDYVWENWEDDDIFFTEDVIGDAIDNGFINDENWEDYLMEESKKSARKSMKEFNEDINNTAYFDRVAGELHSWYVCYVEDYERKYEYGFKNEKECINWIKKNGFDLDPSMNESKKSARKSIKESNLPKRVYDVLDELAYNSYLDYGEFVEFERNGLEHHFDKIRELGAKLKKADMKGDDDLYQKIADEIVTVVKRANGTLDESKKSARKSIKESRGQTVAELLQYASIKTIVHIYSDSTGDEFVGTNDQLKGEFSRFLYYTVSVWNIGNDKIVNIYCY